MSVDIAIAGISFGMALVNSVAVAGVYLRYIRDARNVIYQIRACANGEIEICDPLNLIK